MTCKLGTLAEQAARVRSTIRATPHTVGPLSNSANVVGIDAFNPDWADNPASTQTRPYDPDGGPPVTKSDSPDPMVAGELLTYALTVG